VHGTALLGAGALLNRAITIPLSPAVARAWPAVEEIAAANENESVLVVRHSTLMRLVLGMTLDRYRSAFPSVRSVAITTITLDSGPALHAYNVPTD